MKDNLTLIKGNHSFKVGGEMSYEKIVHDTLLDNYGVFTFNGTKTGNAYADFLLGLPSTMTQDAPVRKTDNGGYLSLFAQDDYRIHPRLTLNLGVRYDLQPPYTDPLDRKLAYVPGQKSQVSPTAPEGLLFPGDPGIPRGIAPTDKNNIAPRVGMAWDPTGNGRLSVRAATGVFYGSITGNEWNTTADNQPFTVRQSFPTVKTLSDPYGNLPGGVGPFPFLYDPASPRFTLPAQVFGPSLDFVWPYSYQSNVTVEKQMFGEFSVSASYVNSLGRSLPASLDRNYPKFGPGATTANVNARRPYQPGVIGAARVLESIFASDYHGVQFRAEKRGARYSFNGYYSYSKALEDLDYQGGGLPAVQNSDRPELERGRTSADRRHSFVFSGVWNPDYFADSSPVVKALLNDWTISGIVTLLSGAPMTISTGVDRNLDGLMTDRAGPRRRLRAGSRSPARRDDRAVVQHRGVRPAGYWRRRQLRAEPRGRSRVSQHRSRRVPHVPVAAPHDAAVSPRSDQRAELRQPDESGDGAQRADHVRQDPVGPRHAARAAGRPRVVLKGPASRHAEGRTQKSKRKTKN